MVSISYEFLQKSFFQTSYLNLDFTSNNSAKLHAKKSAINMTKFASLKKIHTEIIIVKRNVKLNDQRLSNCFEETIGFDIKASFASRPLSHLIR